MGHRLRPFGGRVVPRAHIELAHQARNPVSDELKALQSSTGASGKQLVFGTRSGQPLNSSNTLNRWWYPTLARAGLRRLDHYSLRHKFASLARNADVSGFLVSRAMGHATSGLVGQVNADALPLGMAQLAERVVERALSTKSELRFIRGGNQRSIRQPLDDSPPSASGGGVSS